MARVNLEDVNKFGSSLNAFFSLKDDGDVARVRIMYETIDDVEAYSLHRVKIGNSERYVNCLRDTPDAPHSDCPLCANGSNPIVRLFLPLYCEDEKVVKFWERGKTIIKRLQSLFSRYNPLCAQVLEIERNGKAGDNQTSYSFYPSEDSEKVSMDDLPEVPEILGSYVLDKTKAELEEFLETGKMPGEVEKPSKGRNVEEDGNVRRRGNTRNSRRAAF